MLELALDRRRARPFVWSGLQPTRRLVHLTSWLSLALVWLLMTGCSQDPVERTIERLDELVVLLETHKDEPPVMLDELETWIDDHEGQWQADRAEVDALDDEARTRLEARHENRLHAVLGRFYDVTQEILVTLEDDPENRTRFVTLLNRIE